MIIKPKAAPVMSGINVIPMADIMLVLLITFMVITPLLHDGFPVDMAKVGNPLEMNKAAEDDAIIVAITRDGSIFLGMKQVSPGALRSRVLDLIAQHSDKTVFVRSDRRAKYGAVVAAVDEVRTAGVDRIGLLTEKSGGRQSWE